MSSFRSIGIQTTHLKGGAVRQVTITIPGPCSASAVAIHAELSWDEVAMLHSVLGRAIRDRDPAQGNITKDFVPVDWETQAKWFEDQRDEALALLKAIAEDKAFGCDADEFLRRQYPEVWGKIERS